MGWDSAGEEKGVMQCPERERLEFALMEMLDRLDYLQKLRLDDPNLGGLKQEVERLTLKIQQVQRELQAHRDAHGC
jgi:hypothetical protein